MMPPPVSTAVLMMTADSRPGYDCDNGKCFGFTGFMVMIMIPSFSPLSLATSKTKVPVTPETPKIAADCLRQPHRYSWRNTGSHEGWLDTACSSQQKEGRL